jgi:hypothetical protein
MQAMGLTTVVNGLMPVPRAQAPLRTHRDADKFGERSPLVRACFNVEPLETRTLFALAAPAITPPPVSPASFSQATPLVLSASNISSVNQPPTVSHAAAASPNPVTGTSTALSVLGADDGGESNLTYSWSVFSKPAGALAPSFTSNGTNAAKNTIATFSHFGSYTLEVTIVDTGGLSTTSQVTVQVNQKLTSINVTPANNTVAVLQTIQFSATALDQFGHPMQTQPSFTWTTGPGVINLLGLISSLSPGTYSVSASSGGVTGSTTFTAVASNTAVASPSTVTGTSTALSVIGGTGSSYSWSVISKPVGAANPTFSANNSALAQTTVATFSSVGNYVFRVSINAGVVTTETVAVNVIQTLSSIAVTPTSASVNENQKSTFTAAAFDQFGASMTSSPVFSWIVKSGGGAIDQSGTYTAAGAGQAGPVTVAVESGSVIGSASVTVVNAAPTIAQAASALPSSVTGTTTVLSVLGADDGGESNLKYHWAVTGPEAVSFSSNNSNAAKLTTATFTKAGLYTFTATITDAEGRTTTTQTTFGVQQKLSGLTIVPDSPTVGENGQLQFTVIATDQLGNVMTSPAVAWSIVSGSGTISSTGLYTAPTLPATATIEATVGSLTAISLVTTVNRPPTVATAANASPSPVAGTTALLSVLGADDGGESNLVYTWSATGPTAVVFSDNGTNRAKSATATFSSAGTYHFLVTIRDQGGLSTTSAVTVTVRQTYSRIAVTPSASSVERAGTVNFSAVALDQFGAAMPVQPVFNWSVTSAEGSINHSGVYAAPASGNGNVTIVASSGGISGSATVHLINELSASVPQAQFVSENAFNVFGNGNAITISDGDVKTQTVPVSITLSATNGMISLAKVNGLTFSGTRTSATMTFTGQLADLNAALNGMKFTPTQGFAGQATIYVIINETGNSGSREYAVPITVAGAAITNLPSGSSDGSSGSGTGGSTSPVGTGQGATGVLASSGPGNTRIPSAIPTPLPSATFGSTSLTNEPTIILSTDPSAQVANAPDAAAPQSGPVAESPVQMSAPTPPAAAINNTANLAGSAGGAPTLADAKPGPQPQAGVPNIRIVAAPSQVFSSPRNHQAITHEIDDAKNQMISQWVAKVAARSAALVSLLASAVYFISVLRGVSLENNTLSAPVWNSMDPLSVLDSFESRRRRKQHRASEGKSLESLINQLKVKRNHPSARPLQSRTEAGKEKV